MFNFYKKRLELEHVRYLSIIKKVMTVSTTIMFACMILTLILTAIFQDLNLANYVTLIVTFITLLVTANLIYFFWFTRHWLIVKFGKRIICEWLVLPYFRVHTQQWLTTHYRFYIDSMEQPEIRKCKYPSGLTFNNYMHKGKSVVYVNYIPEHPQYSEVELVKAGWFDLWSSYLLLGSAVIGMHIFTVYVAIMAWPY